MALTSDRTWEDIVTKEVENILVVSEIVLDAAVVYRGAYCTRDTTTGEIKPFDGTATDRAVGWSDITKTTGNAAAPRNHVAIKAGGFQARIPVTGVADDATDYGAPVFATDDGTYSLTNPGTGHRVGAVIGNRAGLTAGIVWVLFRNMTGLVGGE